MNFCSVKYVLAAGAFLILSVITTISNAETINSEGAIKILIGKTWAGKNQQGSDYWFWHEQGAKAGKFGAKFNNPSKGVRIHHGKWEMQDESVCWYWPDWNKTNCYVKFKLDGNKLDMTRSDGLVHSGTLVDGNTEGL